MDALVGQMNFFRQSMHQSQLTSQISQLFGLLLDTVDYFGEQMKCIHLTRMQTSGEKSSVKNDVLPMSYGDSLHNLSQPNAMIIDPGGIQVNVPVFRLDDIIKILGLPSPTKIKIDVDGVDLDVLKGSVEALKTVTSLVIEYMPNSDTRNEIHNFLSDYGFTFDFDSAGENSWGTVDGFFSK